MTVNPPSSTETIQVSLAPRPAPDPHPPTLPLKITPSDHKRTHGRQRPVNLHPTFFPPLFSFLFNKGIHMIDHVVALDNQREALRNLLGVAKEDGGKAGATWKCVEIRRKHMGEWGFIAQLKENFNQTSLPERVASGLYILRGCVWAGLGVGEVGNKKELDFRIMLSSHSGLTLR